MFGALVARLETFVEMPALFVLMLLDSTVILLD